MIPDNVLCRFMHQGAARLGLVKQQQLYDLTMRYRTLGAWLRAASGRLEQAFGDLADLADQNAPIGPANLLADIASGFTLLAPLDEQEVWAFGVTYEMSREARMRESNQPTIYGKVYEAPRPEIFFKATPHRVVGHGEAVAVRVDSTWNVPEAELTLVLTPCMEIVGYTIGNDMSSRDIEGQNPLYLPQAKVYNRCCALGPFIRLAEPSFNPLDLDVTCTIYRSGVVLFSGQTHTGRIHRKLADLAVWLGRCNSYPDGVFAMTGTGIVPPDTISLAAGDTVEIAFEGLGTLTNPVIELNV
ncbi:MAG: fumarylacetoacetate hydrolase family protein [Chloroflexi bacterium]|nr:fumarylacetoacetate hydrolase family protein [Chloroflexota bacterium]